MCVRVALTRVPIVFDAGMYNRWYSDSDYRSHLLSSDFFKACWPASPPLSLLLHALTRTRTHIHLRLWPRLTAHLVGACMIARARTHIYISSWRSHISTSGNEFRMRYQASHGLSLCVVYRLCMKAFGGNSHVVFQSNRPSTNPCMHVRFRIDLPDRFDASALSSCHFLHPEVHMTMRQLVSL